MCICRDVRKGYRTLKEKVKEYDRKEAQFYGSILKKMNKLEQAESAVSEKVNLSRPKLGWEKYRNFWYTVLAVVKNTEFIAIFSNGILLSCRKYSYKNSVSIMVWNGKPNFRHEIVNRLYRYSTVWTVLPNFQHEMVSIFNIISYIPKFSARYLCGFLDTIIFGTINNMVRYIWYIVLNHL